MREIPLDRRRRTVLFAALAIAAVLAVALLPGAAAAGRGDGSVPRRAQPARVAIAEFAFRPRKLTVRRGTKVVFANRDSTVHTATRAGSFDTGEIRPGRAVAVRLRRAGVYAFHCTIHPFMRGKIVVR